MKLGIIGYGRMGKIIESIAKQRGHDIVSIVDIDQGEITKEAECYIDFSIGKSIDYNLTKLCELQIPVVTGVTGWLDNLPFYIEMFKNAGNTGIWGGNFSLGVNLFWKAVKQATQTFDMFAKEYDIMIHEFHHKNKIDSPSGTAIETANIVIANSSEKDAIVSEELKRRREDNELHVSSTRGGSIPGTHSVIFDSNFDTVEITHTARTREGFALGAVLAAEKINTLEIGLHNFSEVFDRIVGGES